MALYAIGDLHLSLGADKPMDVFGGSWNNYVVKIREGFSGLGQTDTCVICGDASWGKTLNESLPDFKFIDSLPGKKIILKGNHDYWWTTVSKLKAFFDANGITTIDILNNNSFDIDGVAVCGTRGWFYDEDQNRCSVPGRGDSDGADHDKKIMLREIGRLEASLASSCDTPSRKICFLHYPPIFKNYLCREIVSAMNNYGVKSCWYGHIHGLGHKYAVTGLRDGIDYHMVSADFVNFTPVKVVCE
jgi:predicted phosphohydrolase